MTKIFLGCSTTSVCKTPTELLILVPLLFSSGVMSRTLEVGPDKQYKIPSAAANVAQDGDVIAISPGEYFDCAVWKAKNLVIEGTGPGASAVITDKSCQGKALFIITGYDVTVRNLTLQRARVPDGNGAGIRIETKRLTVDGVKFINNQNGILGGKPGTSVAVRNSEFIKNGVCDPSCAHGIYVGKVDLLQVENSKFAETKQGHHIKSRALRTEITNCEITDGSDGTASYLIDIPNGGSVIIRDNKLIKGPKSENHSSAISIGAEGVKQPTKELIVENNTFRNDGNYKTFFVNNLTATEAKLKGNKISGAAEPLRGDGTVD